MVPGGGLTAMLAMLTVSLPMYVCATASTPIAAALALKGFSPGALLVFLLAGPATNAATMVMVGRLLGKRAAIIYVGSIIVVTLACAVAADALYLALGFEVHAWLADSGVQEGGLVLRPGRSGHARGAAALRSAHGDQSILAGQGLKPGNAGLASCLRSFESAKKFVTEAMPNKCRPIKIPPATSSDRGDECFGEARSISSVCRYKPGRPLPGPQGRCRPHACG
jgi:hypothetical protein